MRGNGVVVNADGHGDFAGDGLVKSQNLLFRQGLIGDCRQEQRIGASPLRILCQTKDPIGPQRADPCHKRHRSGMRFGLSDNLHSLLAAEPGIASRGTEHAESIDGRFGEASDNPGKSGFINAMLM